MNTPLAVTFGLAALVGLSPVFVSSARADEPTPVKVFTATGTDYATVKFFLTEAIKNKGLLISGTLHVQDMLARTAGDLGYGVSPYRHAESVEFCSADLSHQMIQAHPANLTVCPFTIAVYTLTGDEEDTVYVAYELPRLAGDALEVQSDVTALLDAIVGEAIE